MPRTRTTALLSSAALLAGLLAAAPPASAAPYCGITWGSTAEVADRMSAAHLRGVRSGRHTCFDRLVTDLGPGPLAGYRAEYVPAITQDGSGSVIPTRGGAALQLTLHAPAYDDDGRATFSPANRREVVPVAGYSTFRQVVYGGSFEGSSTLGLGVRARLPFRVFVLDGPGNGSRVVLDVAHRW